MMKRFVLALALGVASGNCAAAGAEMHLLEARVDLSDRPSLQHGAKIFVNYCLSCHSMEYMRYKRMGEDLGLSEQQVAYNMMFAADKVGSQMTVAMKRGDAQRWFGIAPPDLSVIARSRSADWLYSYLVTFYEDDNPSRPFGVNNVVLDGVGMPHVLWPLQGHQRYVKAELEGDIINESISSIEASGNDLLVHRSVKLKSGDAESVKHVTDRLQVSIPGSMRPGEYRAAMRDLVNFLVYAGEPAQLKRYTIGVWVLAFLAVLFVLSRMLYKEYWRDVH